MDLGPFFRKWLADARDAQSSDGRFPDFAPHPFGPDARFSGVPAWGDAGVVVPWSAYQSYGDRRVLEESWDSVTRWIEWIRKNNPDLVWRNARNNDYGDWLNGVTLVADGWSKDGCEVPKDLFATAMFARSVEIAAKMARALERADAEREYAALRRDVESAFRREFALEDGSLRGDTQAGYALALAFDLLPEKDRERALERLVNGIRSRGGALTTGMMSTHFALIELSRRGQHELACAIALRRDFPSWGFAIDNGATTLWERWDGFVPGRGFQDAGMNSFNHWAFGSIGEWLMRMVAGIDPDESSPAWTHVTIRPRPGFITHARGEYDSIRGRIASEWSVEDGALLLDVEIPVGTTATIVLPEDGGGEATEVGAGRYHFRRELPE
jgi:alpha-L-rhamnosidase